MRFNVLFREDNAMNTDIIFREGETFNIGFDSINVATESDYNKLVNKPSINGVTLQGDLTVEDIGLGTGSGTANFPEEGLVGDILMKTGLETNEVSWVTPATSAEEDNTRPITAGAVYTEIGNINALLATI